MKKRNQINYNFLLNSQNYLLFKTNIDYKQKNKSNLKSTRCTEIKTNIFKNIKNNKLREIKVKKYSLNKFLLNSNKKLNYYLEQTNMVEDNLKDILYKKYLVKNKYEKHDPKKRIIENKELKKYFINTKFKLKINKNLKVKKIFNINELKTSKEHLEIIDNFNTIKNYNINNIEKSLENNNIKKLIRYTKKSLDKVIYNKDNFYNIK